MTKKQFYLEIWEERKVCREDIDQPWVYSELSGEPLLPPGHPQWHFQFLHILGHGPYPRFKWKKENIMMGLPEEHQIQERFDAFLNRKDELIQEYYADNQTT